ncbi:hypothetical protein LZ641_09155, partial [Hafnia paralvei]|uniref:hypothetical protein n=2 Tax=Hafnia paralvei TaxID=546367 RepID=UPI001F42E224
KSARVESPRATGLSSVAYASGFMETHLLTGERNISPQFHRILTFQTVVKITASAETTRWWSLPVRLHKGINEARYEQAGVTLHSSNIGDRNISPQFHRILTFQTGM